jgi:hypothetical protein
LKIPLIHAPRSAWPRQAVKSLSTGDMRCHFRYNVAVMQALFPIGTLVYADTSVFGGVFDAAFERSSRAFFEAVKAGRFRLVVSTTLDDEIKNAPEYVLRFYRENTRESAVVAEAESIEELKNAYLAHGILTTKWEADALHVASAVVGSCDIIVSWNFKHIVHFEKIRLYNAVNTLFGYREIFIHTPSEVIEIDEI